MPVSIASIFIEEVEKAFKDVLPPAAVKVLIVMASQMMEMENAMNKQQQMIMKLMKFAVLSEQYRHAMESEVKKFDEEVSNTLAMSEKIKEEDGI